MLPLVKKHFDDTGERPLLMVAEAYASIFERISYAVPLAYKGKFTEVNKALEQAAQITTNIVLCQIYGDGIRSMEIATSFVRESWIQAGASVPWGTLPLEFDKRDAMREKALWDSVVGEDVGKKIVLVATEGHSSPFPFTTELFRALEDLGFHYRVVSLNEVRAENIVDLLGLMDRAHCLVTVDTGILHLAHASRVPVITLVTSRPSKWHGSAWRPSHVARYLYEEVPDNTEAIVTAIKGTGEYRLPYIFHGWAVFSDPDSETQRRIGFAQETWSQEYRTVRWDADLSTPERSALEVGDEKPVAFLRDIIEGCVKAADFPDDIVAITNADVSFIPGLTGYVLEACRRFGAAFTHRWDFDRLETPLINEAQLKCGKWYPGSDAFFFTVEWWMKHGHELPDMIMGREKNDEVFRQLIKRFGGVEIPACIYHEKHNSYWERPENFETNAGNRHNRKLAEAWFERTGYSPDDWRWWPAIEGGWQFSSPLTQRKA